MINTFWFVCELVGLWSIVCVAAFGVTVCVRAAIWNLDPPKWLVVDLPPEEPLFMRGECPTDPFIRCRSTEEVEFKDDTVIERG